MGAMTDDIKALRKEYETKWLADMERIGPTIIQTRLANRMAITDVGPYPDADFVRAWLHKKERAAKRGVIINIFVAVITMIAACIAAWPILRSWW
jgi:hypothetical protein